MSANIHSAGVDCAFCDAAHAREWLCQGLFDFYEPLGVFQSVHDAQSAPSVYVPPGSPRLRSPHQRPGVRGSCRQPRCAPSQGADHWRTGRGGPPGIPLPDTRLRHNLTRGACIGACLRRDRRLCAHRLAQRLALGDPLPLVAMATVATVSLAITTQQDAPAAISATGSFIGQLTQTTTEHLIRRSWRLLADHLAIRARDRHTRRSGCPKRAFRCAIASRVTHSRLSLFLKTASSVRPDRGSVRPATF